MHDHQMNEGEIDQVVNLGSGLGKEYYLSLSSKILYLRRSLLASR